MLKKIFNGLEYEIETIEDHLTDMEIKYMANHTKKEIKKMSEGQIKYGDNLDKVIEENEDIFSRLTTLENKITAMISLYRDVIISQDKLWKRIKRLEEKDDIDNIKIGLTD